MKTTIKIVSAFVMVLCFFSATAQYTTAVGVRFEDDYFLGSYKMNMNESMSVEGFGGFDTQSFISLIKLGGEVQINTPIDGVDGLRWFYGAGASIIFGDLSGVNIFGTGGLDYYFEELPLNLSLEIMPGYYLGDFNNEFQIDFALGARYILGD